MQSADVVLYIFDLNEMLPGDLEAIRIQFEKTNKQYLFAGNKADQASSAIGEKFAGTGRVIKISAKENTGIDEIKNVLFNIAVQDPAPGESIVLTNARHYEALQQVHRSLTDIKAGMDHSIPADLLALDIRRCLHYISEITGDISNERCARFYIFKILYREIRGETS